MQKICEQYLMFARKNFRVFYKEYNMRGRGGCSSRTQNDTGSYSVLYYIMLYIIITISIYKLYQGNFTKSIIIYYTQSQHLNISFDDSKVPPERVFLKKKIKKHHFHVST